MNVPVWRFIGLVVLILGVVLLYLGGAENQTGAILFFVLAAIAWSESNYLDLKSKLSEKSS